MYRIKPMLLALALTTLSACAANSPAPAAATASPSATPAAVDKEASPAELERTIIELEKKCWELYINNRTEELKKYRLPGHRALYSGQIKTSEEDLQEAKNYVIKNFSMSDEQVTFPVKDTALLTYKYTDDSTYKGKPTSSSTLVATVWVRINGEWKSALYADTDAAPAK